MKRFTLVSIFILLVVMVVAVFPASAQLGDTDVSSFTVQNISAGDATVTVSFVAEDGTVYTPLYFNDAHTDLNPFTLGTGASKQVYVPGIPADQLPSGRYSMMISSDAQVAAIASVAGTGTRRFTGSYNGFDVGAQTFYLPTFAYNYYGWYSMISVQNLGDAPADVTVNISCSNNSSTGTLTQLDIPAKASHTFTLKSLVPNGFTSSTQCVGSAKVTADQNIVATDSQNVPTAGNTNTFSGFVSGYTKLYVPALTNNYFGWKHSLNILKLGSGNTTVTVTYSDGATPSTCNLTDAMPSCQVYMPTAHPGEGLFGATVTSSPAMEMVAVATSSKGTSQTSYHLSSAYNAVGDGTGSANVSMTEVVKAYYGWNSAWTCQNVGTESTQLTVSYQGYAASAYTHPQTLDEGDTVQVYVPGETFLPVGYQGGATIAATNTNADIACIVDFTHVNWKDATKPGDWTQGYNALNK